MAQTSTTQSMNIDSAIPFNILSDREEVKRSETNQQEEKPFELYYKQRTGTARCLILNYTKFDYSHVISRPWSKIDVNTICTTFEQLNFTVQVHDDLSYSETIALIQKESKRHDNLNLNCFVLFILSHQTISKNGSALFWCRDNCLSLELIVDQMTKPSCSMAGRPKIILMEVGHDYKTGTLAHDSLNLNPPKKPNQYLIPRYADWIMFKLSHNGYMLSHLEKNGSIYIRKLCDILRKYSQQHDLSTILTMVSGSIHKIDQTQYGNAMIQIISTLTHLIQFNYKSHE